MRSRSWLEPAGLWLGAATDGIWCGALAAALTGASWAALAVFATVTVVVAASAARRLGRGEVGERMARLLTVALILVASAVLFAAGRSWTHANVLWQVVRDVVFVSGLVFLGIYLGRDSQAPDAAVRRAVRGFALLCAVLLGAALAGSAPGWASGALVAALLAGGLLIAVVRYRALTDLVDPADRLPAWPWLLAVTGAVLGVIAVGALLSQLLSLDVLHWALGAVGGLLRYALDGAAYVIGWAGAGIIRGIAWLLSAFHVHALRAAETPHAAATPPVLKLHRAEGVKIWSGAKVIGAALGALVAVGLSLTLVVVALRRFRRKPPPDVAVLEEREALTSLRSAAGESAARLGRRLRRRLQALRRRDALTPAELVRRRYAELERRLARAGQPRPPGVTVRDHLAAAAAVAGMAAAPPAAAPDEAAPSAPLQTAADLAALYDLARYSAHAIDAAHAQRFESLARAFET